jgi:hypothetical protein
VDRFNRRFMAYFLTKEQADAVKEKRKEAANA